MKILDSNGAELKQGDRVRRIFGSGVTGGIVVFVSHRKVWVAFVGTGRPVARFDLIRRFPFSRTFTCPDLSLERKQ